MISHIATFATIFFIMILGSLTLGFAFADRWSLCCSTGWGGAFGIEVSGLLRTHIGAVGTLLMGIFFFGDSAGFWRLFSAALIVLGVIGMKLSS